MSDYMYGKHDIFEYIYAYRACLQTLLPDTPQIVSSDRIIAAAACLGVDLARMFSTVRGALATHFVKCCLVLLHILGCFELRIEPGFPH